jgi:hypothetical protein
MTSLLKTSEVRSLNPLLPALEADAGLDPDVVLITFVFPILFPETCSPLSGRGE